MNMKDISIDTYDIIIYVTLIGGFATGNWMPAWIFCGVYALSEIFKRGC